MIVGKDKVITWLTSCSAPYWQIFVYGGSQPAWEGDNEKKELTLTASIENLSKVLDLLHTGRYRIRARRNPDATWGKGTLETPFEIIEEEKIMQQVSQVAGNGNTEKYVEARIGQLRAEMQLQYSQDKIKELEQELDELDAEEKAPDVWERVADKVLPYIPSLAKVMGLEPTEVAITGVEEKTNTAISTGENTKTNDLQTRTSNALRQWSEADPDFIRVLEKIADLAKNKTKTYNAYKPILLNM
jgi:hypothetical protein